MTAYARPESAAETGAPNRSGTPRGTLEMAEPPRRVVPEPVIVLPVSGARQAVRRSRDVCRTVFEAWGLPAEVVDDAVTVISELVTNAAVHGAEPAWLRAGMARDGLEVEVHDAGPLTSALEYAVAWPTKAAGVSAAPAWAAELTDDQDAHTDWLEGRCALSAETDDVGGRGLLVVSSLTSTLCVLSAGGMGKSVRARLDVAGLRDSTAGSDS